MRNSPIPAILVTVLVVFLLVVDYARPMLGGAHPAPMPDNTAGPDLTGARKPREEAKSMPPRAMSRTTSSYLPPPSVATS
jgi:hypothetical protein